VVCGRRAAVCCSERSASLTRRGFHQHTLSSLLTFSLLETLFRADAFGDEIKPIAAQWLSQLNELCSDLKGRELNQITWQAQVEQLMTRVNLPDMLKFIDFDNLTRNIAFREQGEKSLQARFPQVEGLPTNLIFGHQIFALQKGRSVVPHGHDNMATAFLILQGDFAGRHYDRLDDDAEHMIIKPTIDRAFTVGEYSTISDYRDNVHWFKASSETAFIFNIHVLNVAEGRRSGRIYVDPNGEKLSGDRIRARKLGATEAFKLYG
jgi:hypothetical protein